MRNRKYLVTGGSGFLGSALVKSLVRAGYTIRILDNNSRGSMARLGTLAQEVECIEGDIRDSTVVEQAAKGMDGICHLAFVNGTQYFYERPAYVLDVGVKGMVNVLDACLKADVGELVLASSSEVYQTPSCLPTDEQASLSVPDPLNPRYSYGGGKIISELMAINYGREYFEKVLIFRPHNVFGPDMGWEHVIPQFVTRLVNAKQTSKAMPIPFEIQGNGEQSRAFIYIEDFTQGLLQVIEKGKHLNIYNIGTMDERKIKDVAHLTAQYLNMKIKLIPGAEAVGGTLRRCPNIAKLKDLGFEPQVSFEDALQVTAKWYENALKSPSSSHNYEPC